MNCLSVWMENRYYRGCFQFILQLLKATFVPASDIDPEILGWPGKSLYVKITHATTNRAIEQIPCAFLRLD
jgi:hypothetical protein